MSGPIVTWWVLREQVVRPLEGGASRRATAARFEQKVSRVVELMQRARR